ncbi:hypothetical protein DMENIID0001_093190 [Sergentomyia squamirostris]
MVLLHRSSRCTKIVLMMVMTMMAESQNRFVCASSKMSILLVNSVSQEEEKERTQSEEKYKRQLSLFMGEYQTGCGWRQQRGENSEIFTLNRITKTASWRS